jgi:4-carboxymuconolactone decarboxylase
MTPAQKAIGDFAPKLVSVTDDVLFGDVWERTKLSKRDRSLISVVALITNGSTEQLRGHLARAKDNGLSEAELKEVIIHLAFYAGWPRAMSAVTVEGDLRRLSAADPAHSRFRSSVPPGAGRRRTP